MNEKILLSGVNWENKAKNFSQLTFIKLFASQKSNWILRKKSAFKVNFMCRVWVDWDKGEGMVWKTLRMTKSDECMDWR